MTFRLVRNSLHYDFRTGIYMIRISNPVLFKKYVRQVFMQDGRNTKKLRSPRIKTKRMERDSIIDSQADEELGSILANDLREVIEQI